MGDFWKRWHISLSSWLKDYLYIPMGGNKKGSWATYLSVIFILIFIVLLSSNKVLSISIIVVLIMVLMLSYRIPSIKRIIVQNINLMMTMLLGGLWHGASWNFVFWGGINGIGIIVYKLWRKISPWEKKYQSISNSMENIPHINFYYFYKNMVSSRIISNSLRNDISNYL